jgi:hypothetical protein
MFGDKFHFEWRWVLKYIGHRSFFVLKGCLIIDRHLIMGCFNLFELESLDLKSQSLNVILRNIMPLDHQNIVQ